MELDWENLVEDWDGENCWINQAWEDCSGPKKNLGDSSNRDCTFAIKDYAVAVSRPCLGVLAALAGMENKALFNDMIRCLIV